VETVKDVLRHCAGERGDSVVALHTPKSRVVACAAELFDGEVLILDFGFLQAKDIRLVEREPFEDEWQTSANGIDVISGDLHPENRNPEDATRLAGPAQLLGSPQSTSSLAGPTDDSLPEAVIGLAPPLAFRAYA
jgi:hypothetical protein